jgi:hypothetical protein
MLTRDTEGWSTQRNLAKPRTDLRRAMMLAALELSLEGVELRDHSLLRGDPPDVEGSAGLALPNPVRLDPDGQVKIIGYPCP